MKDSKIFFGPGSYPFSLTKDDDPKIFLQRERSRVLELKGNGGNSSETIVLHLIPTPTSSEATLPPFFNRDWTDHQEANTKVMGATNSPFLLDPISKKVESPSFLKTEIYQTTQNTKKEIKKVIHLHQDLWESKRNIVQCRLLANMGQYTRRIFARKTHARKINATFAMEFLEDHHLWGATRAKHYYGLFWNNNSRFNNDDDEQVLVAVATFSNRRKVIRGGVSHRSHELLRFCTRRDTTVVGGISKLIQAFVQDYQPDDLVTVVDRDWGGGSGWHSIGFETVEILDPNIMVVNPNNKEQLGIRRHLVGAGVSHDNPNMGRLGLVPEILEQLNQTTSAEDALEVLELHGHFPVYDSGVERLIKIVAQKSETEGMSATSLWDNSEPKYSSVYYSDNRGIAHLLKFAAVKPIGSAAESTPCYLSLTEREYLKSWRSSSRSTSSCPPQRLFAMPSTLDPTATVEICDRGNGWRTMGIHGGVTKSIFHSIFKVDPITQHVEPTVVVLEYVKTMLAAFLGATNTSPRTKPSMRSAHLGVASGTLLRLLAHHFPESQHVAVEIDNGVVAALERLLPPFSSNIEIRQEDALFFGRLSSYENDTIFPFDVVFMDVFDEKLLHPPSFYSNEYLKHLYEVVLNKTGIVVCNLHSGGKKRDACIQAAYQAYSEVFPRVLLFDSVDSRPNGGNTILVASPCAALSVKEMQRSVEQYNQQDNDAIFSFDVKARLGSPRHVKG